MGVLKKIAIVLGYILLFAAIIAAILFADYGIKEHRGTQQIAEFNIYIEGEGDNSLVDEVVMSTWLDKHGIHPNGRTIADVDLAELEHVALQHSAVKSANAYVTHEGRLEMTIVQREPMLRIRCDGYDRYVSKDGYIFAPTQGCTAYVPIVTGDYKFVFDGVFSGYSTELLSDSLSAMQRRIDSYEFEKYKLIKDRKDNDSDLKRVNDSTIYKPFWMSKSRFEQREEELKVFQEGYARKHAEKDAQIERKIQQLSSRQQTLHDGIKQLNKRYEDYLRLLDVVEYISADKFWSAEFLQIVAHDGGDKMQLSAVTRSGGFLVELGDTYDIEHKLKSLRRFYDEVLSNVGWDAYSRISVRYDGQVVCQKAT